MSMVGGLSKIWPGTISTLLGLVLLCLPANAQRPGSSGDTIPKSEPMMVNISVRDARGMPLESSVLVRLYSAITSYDVQSPTREASTAVFQNVLAGEYEVEIKCSGFKTAHEHVSVFGYGADFHTYVFLVREGEEGSTSKAPSGTVMSPKLQGEMEKGLEAMRKRHYDEAKAHFLKATEIGPTNSDAAYLLGTAELALQQKELARKAFDAALKIEPTHERALVALGELQLQGGQTKDAIATLQKAYAVNGAGWRMHLLLASAYAKDGQLPEAEKHAQRAAALAQDQAAPAFFLLGEIQAAEGNLEDAQRSWQQVIDRFPADPIVPQAKEKLALSKEPRPEGAKEAAANLPMPMMTAASLSPMVERPWAPPDIDSMEYSVASQAPCNIDEVLARGLRRMRAQMGNFEKFTATERIEHQEIDRYGMPGPVRARDFSYIVFVHTFKEDSFYLEESRYASQGPTSFPTSLATTGLNSLGVSVLQPAYQGQMVFRCEGLANVRGQAAWQIRFEEEKDAGSSIRRWRRADKVYEIPVKGRIWISATSYDLIRIETDLMRPFSELELNRDHLLVDYGPVTFASGKTTLWLPWSAEMYMELRGKRYHHRHFLTDYLLFSVDTSNKTGKPEQAPPVKN